MVMDILLNAKTALLAALVGGPGFGLELIDRVSARTLGLVKLNQGSVYPALRALEQDGLVRSYDGETNEDRGGRPRRYYELTGDGVVAARRQRKALMGLLKPVEVLP